MVTRSPFSRLPIDLLTQILPFAVTSVDNALSTTCINRAARNALSSAGIVLSIEGAFRTYEEWAQLVALLARACPRTKEVQFLECNIDHRVVSQSLDSFSRLETLGIAKCFAVQGKDTI